MLSSHVPIVEQFLSIPSPSALVERLYSVDGKMLTPSDMQIEGQMT